MTSAYGIMNCLKFGLGIQPVNNDVPGEPPPRGFEDLKLLAKLRLIEEKQIWPATALSLDVSMTRADQSKGLSTGKSDQALTLILSKLYEPAAGLHLNLGYLLVDSPRGNKLKNRFMGGSQRTTEFIRGSPLLVKCLVLRVQVKVKVTQRRFSSLCATLKQNLVFDRCGPEPALVGRKRSRYDGANLDHRDRELPQAGTDLRGRCRSHGHRD